MASKKECAKNRTFNGNKHCGDPHNCANRFFCRYAQDRVETGRRLADLRQEKKMHMTRQKFLDFLDEHGYLRISMTTLWKWETGRAKIGDEEIEALCAALGCRRDELVVYRIREIDDERDQLAHLIITHFNILYKHLLFQQVLIFLSKEPKSSDKLHSSRTYFLV